MKHAWVFAAVVSLSAQAKPPGLDHLFPAGGKADSTFEVSIAGNGLEKTKVSPWTPHPGIAFTATEKDKLFRVSIAADVPPGPYLVRFITSEGATPPRIFVVGTLAERLETAAGPAPLDCIINGVLSKAGEVDTLPIQVRKGQPIELDLVGYRLGSSMDPALRLLDERGVEIASSHDTRTLDPHLRYTPKADGILRAQVMAFAHPPAADVALKGSASHVYRLSVTTVHATKPTPAPAEIKLGDAIYGSIATPAEADRVAFIAKKGESYHIAARGLGHSPLDALLRIEDAKGSTLQEADDSDKDSPDAAITWKAKADGPHQIVVSDRFASGSDQHLYVLTAHEPKATLKVTLDAHRYVMDAGGTVDLKLTVKPTGKFAGKLIARAMQLGHGLSIEPVEVPAKGGEVKLKLTATAEAADTSSPFVIGVCTSAPDAVQCTLAEYDYPFTEPRGDLLIMRDAQAWVLVKPAKKK